MLPEAHITKTATKAKQSARKPSPKTTLKAKKTLSAHLKTIRRAKERTTSFTKLWESSSKAAESTLKIIWEQVFDYLCANPSASIEDLSKIAGIIQKLTACFSQIKGFEHTSDDCESKTPPPTSLPLDVINQIENELKLL